MNNKKNTEYKGLWIPKTLLAYNEWPLAQRLIFADLVSLSEAVDKIFKSNKGFAAQLGINVRTVDRALSDLEAKGLISRTTKYIHSKGGRERVIYLNPNKVKLFLNRLETKCPEPYRHFVSSSIDKMAQVNNIKERTLSKEQEHRSQHRLSSVASVNIIRQAQVLSEITTNLLGHGVSKGDIEFAIKLYETAHKWSLDVANVNIGPTPNDSIIETLSALDDFMYNFDSMNDFVKYLQFRYEERNVARKSKQVNLSWFLASNTENLIEDEPFGTRVRADAIEMSQF
ncbi:hypothetical protein RGQ13_15140 [Thalassotalea psychrophila]|uniref:Uncharacterized protein n=1 Tax=Thalassotalea psychrophila TaxID=3065647 RepID=A0ABY9TRL0_9GAMM|nr:hypothetical protein RGQ13_15140 [Colwelliaceae bacterium SQ149]